MCSGLRKLPVGRSLGLSSSCTLCGAPSVFCDVRGLIFCTLWCHCWATCPRPRLPRPCGPQPVPVLSRCCSEQICCVCVSSSQGQPHIWRDSYPESSRVASRVGPHHVFAEWMRSCRVSPGAPDDAWIGNRCPVKCFWRYSEMLLRGWFCAELGQGINSAGAEGWVRWPRSWFPSLWPVNDLTSLLHLRDASDCCIKWDNTGNMVNYCYHVYY